MTLAHFEGPKESLMPKRGALCRLRQDRGQPPPCPSHRFWAARQLAQNIPAKKTICSIALRIGSSFRIPDVEPIQFPPSLPH